jgi:hypothetical protein
MKLNPNGIESTIRAWCNYPLKGRTGLINRRAPMPRCTHSANRAMVSEFRSDGRLTGSSHIVEKPAYITK